MINSTTPEAAIQQRVREYYAHLNARRFERCYSFLDPRLLAKPNTVTRFQYEAALAEFLSAVAAVRVRAVTITGLHLNEPSKLYEGRDFALGKTDWEDAAGNSYQFAERWVCDGGEWYTRSTGLLMPDPVAAPASVAIPANAAREPLARS